MLCWARQRILLDNRKTQLTHIRSGPVATHTLSHIRTQFMCTYALFPPLLLLLILFWPISTCAIRILTKHTHTHACVYLLSVYNNCVCFGGVGRVHNICFRVRINTSERGGYVKCLFGCLDPTAHKIYGKRVCWACDVAIMIIVFIVSQSSSSACVGLR